MPSNLRVFHNKFNVSGPVQFFRPRETIVVLLGAKNRVLIKGLAAHERRDVE